MLKNISILALVFAAGCAFSQSDRLYGKTHAQVLAMGETKWMNYVADQPGTEDQAGGSSTHGMQQAEAFYLDAASARNDRLIRHLKSAERARLRSIREVLNQAGDSLLRTEYVLTGEGTMYLPMFTSRKVQVEEELYSLMSGTNKEIENPTGNVMREYRDNWQKAQISNASDIVGEMAKDSEKDPKRLIADAMKNLDSALNVVSRLPLKDQSHLRSMVAGWLKPTF